MYLLAFVLSSLFFPENITGQDSTDFSKLVPLDSINIKSSIGTKPKPKFDLEDILGKPTEREKDYSSDDVYVPGGIGNNGDEKNLTVNNLENIDDLRKGNQRVRLETQKQKYSDYAIQIGYAISLIGGIFVMLNFILKGKNRTENE